MSAIRGRARRVLLARNATRRTIATRLGARTNAGLLLLLAAAFITGWLAFAFATAPARWSLVVHATSGVAILLLLPWKSMIAGRGLRRPRGGRWASMLFGVLVIASLLAGLAHSTGAVAWIGPVTPMEVHVGAAVAAVPLAIWHVAARRVRLRHTDISRRTFLRGGIALAGAAATYAASEVAVRAAALPGSSRRFTGSYEAGSFQPEAMPVSSWLFDAVPQIDAARWRLAAGGREWTYDELFSYDDRVTATLDCTGGFYSTQGVGGRAVGQAGRAHRCGEHQGGLGDGVRQAVSCR